MLDCDASIDVDKAEVASAAECPGETPVPEKAFARSSLRPRREYIRGTSPGAAPPCIIYRPSRPVMQGGSRAGRTWILEFERQRPCGIEPLMGWTSCDEPYAQVRLSFPDHSSAVGYADRQGLDYRVIG